MPHRVKSNAGYLELIDVFAQEAGCVKSMAVYRLELLTTCTTEQAAKERAVHEANCSLSGKAHSLSHALESLSAKNCKLITENEAVRIQLQDCNIRLKSSEAQVCCSVILTW
jgi:hypothetical protein